MNENKLRQRIIRDGEFKGYLVANIVGVDNNILIGFSLCDDEDVATKNKAMIIAEGRASGVRTILIPQSLYNQYAIFYERCHRYYKGFNLPVTVSFYTMEKGIKYYNHHKGENILGEALKEKKIQLRKEELERDKTNCDNISYWVAKVQKRNSNYNLVGLYDAMTANKSKFTKEK